MPESDSVNSVFNPVYSIIEVVSATFSFLFRWIFLTGFFQKLIAFIKNILSISIYVKILPC